MDKAPDVDAYLAGVPDTSRPALEALRRAIKAACPDAVELISYGVPSYKYRGKILANFGAAKNHSALYGLVDEMAAHKDELAKYDLSKGTLRFPVQEGLPDKLVDSLIKMRMARIEAAEATKKPARKKPA